MIRHPFAALARPIRAKGGSDADDVAQSEADHFMNCHGCKAWFDMRDLGQVLEHWHDAPVCQQVQRRG
jgi:hypothetical protein